MKQFYLEFCDWFCANPARAVFFAVLGGCLAYFTW